MPQDFGLYLQENDTAASRPEQVAEEALRVAFKARRQREMLQARLELAPQTGKPSRARMGQNKEAKRKREVQATSEGGGKRLQTAPPVSALAKGELGKRLYEAMSCSKGRTINEGGLGHYFLSETFRRAREVSAQSCSAQPCSAILAYV